MLARIQDTARKDCLLGAGATILVGVSGGPDSLCLLHALHRLGYATIAACFNHQLRAEAAAESKVVENLAAQLGIPFIGGQGDVAAAAHSSGQSIEATAREMRYRFLFSSARELQAAAVAVGHNANDQVETVLMHMLRGSGLDGLRGMAYRTLSAWDEQIPLVRPLLRCWREEIQAYCEAAGLQPALDRSNLEPIYLRNRIRLELLPEIERLAPGAREHIWNLAHLAEDELQWLDTLEQQAWTNCVVRSNPSYVRFDLAALQVLAEPLQRRLIRRAAMLLRPSGDGLNYENVQRAVNFIRSPRGDRKIELAQKLELRIQKKAVVLSVQEYRPDISQYPQMDRTLQAALSLPGSLELGSGWRISAEVCAPPDPETLIAARGELQLEAWLDAAAVSGPLAVRPPQPGDRFQPFGMSAGNQKLSDFWINRHVPAAVRPAWPLVVDATRIAWVTGFSPAHAFRVRPETTQCIHLKVVCDK